jgi:hypothetical protein
LLSGSNSLALLRNREALGYRGIVERRLKQIATTLSVEEFK